MGFIAVLWVIGFLLAWHLTGLAAAIIVMTAGPLVAVGLFSSTRKSR